MKLNNRMQNVFSALKQNKRNWENHLFPLEVLEVYDRRTLYALQRRGVLEIHYFDTQGCGIEGYYLRKISI